LLDRHASSIQSVAEDQLVLEACGKLFCRALPAWNCSSTKKPRGQALSLLMDHHVSRGHRDQPRTGCPVAALGSELARRDKRTRRAVITGFLQLSRLIASHLETVPFRKRAERSMAIVAATVGAVTLARIAPDSRISDSVLVVTRDDIIRFVRRHDNDLAWRPC
jgi:TetR/AcrR family transcriptional repressor of nem operon